MLTAGRTVALLVVGALVAGFWVVDAGTQPPASGEAAEAERTRPNVLVIATDDQTVESMKVMRNVKSLIGAKGARFTNSFVNFSLCCPSRATFLTGQYAHNHGVLSNEGRRGGFRRFQSLHANDNLAVWLRRAGYHTALIGRYLNGYKNRPKVPPGWSDWQAAAPGGPLAYEYFINDNGRLVRYHKRPADFKQDVLTRRAVHFIRGREQKPKPFFLWLAYSVPHVNGPNPNPNRPRDCGNAAKPPPRHARAFADAALPQPPNFNEADVSDKPASVSDRPPLGAAEIADIRRKYRCELRSLLSVDDGVKKVVRALRTAGELDDTLLIYTSDNGYFHGEHRIPEGKMRPYEESIRVPLQMRGPGIPKGVKIDPLVINADLAPTIVDAANADPGSAMDGRSLLPVVERPAIARNRALLIEEPGPLAGVQAWGPGFAAIRTERYIYVEYEVEQPELYDLIRDPFQLQNLANHPAQSTLRATLAARLQRLKDCSGPGCRVEFPAAR
jgi:N-acetylglucosamine-6-sulfatase